MTIKEIYEKFDKIGCLSFTTINENGDPESRIAHLLAYDEEGMYFMTMQTKDFYKHLKTNGKISLCGMSACSEVVYNNEGNPIFQDGYAIRMTGVAKEIPMQEIIEKNNPIFDFCIRDQKQYNAMVVFCITQGYGDIFDYDFEKVNRKTKLEREYFSYNGGKIKYKGLKINQEKCISCGICKSKCSFLAITNQNGKYEISKSRCDECGDCYLNCPTQAIKY